MGSPNLPVSRRTAVAKPPPVPEHLANVAEFEGAEVEDEDLFGRWEHQQDKGEKVGRNPGQQITYKDPGTAGASLWEKRIAAAPQAQSFKSASTAIKHPLKFHRQLHREQQQEQHSQSQVTRQESGASQSR